MVADIIIKISYKFTELSPQLEHLHEFIQIS